MTERDWRLSPASWPAERAELLAVRYAVFVEEQGVPLALELDGKDAAARHLLVRSRDGRPIATGRLLPEGQIGRMAVLPDWRGRGIGRQLLEALLQQARARQLPTVFLHAQVGALGFYQAAGFVAEGETFMDAGIPHRTMRRRLTP
jgi:predicted GNAT family N-acyltransferase